VEKGNKAPAIDLHPEAISWMRQLKRLPQGGLVFWHRENGAPYGVALIKPDIRLGWLTGR
jgi:hypothetical protein